MKYNKTRGVIEEKAQDLTIRYTYEYDAQKNWTKQYRFYNDEAAPHFLITRVITYKN